MVVARRRVGDVEVDEQSHRPSGQGEKNLQSSYIGILIVVRKAAKQSACLAVSLKVKR